MSDVILLWLDFIIIIISIIIIIISYTLLYSSHRDPEMADDNHKALKMMSAKKSGFHKKLRINE